MDCVMADGTKKYLPPSQTMNMWCTTETDEANLINWCYRAPPKTAEKSLQEMRAKIQELWRE